MLSIHQNVKMQRGVGLVEVLVAVLVLSFGMLGLVGLQIYSLKSNQSSMERGLAVVQSHSIVDAMRADRTNAINGKFNIAIDASVPTGSSFREIALAEWRADLVKQLGDGATGAISCNGALCDITVRWDDSRGAGAEESANADAKDTDQEDAKKHTVTTVVQL